MNTLDLAASAPIVVWRFTDGKPGHENQSLGLIEALAGMREVERHDVDARGGVWRRLLLRGRRTFDLPAPDLIVGAGHGTHLSVLAAKWRVGGRAVVLMKPTLPVGLFDLCIVPEHDGVRSRANVMSVRGVLNRMRPSPDHDEGRGLMLIGGPSKHAAWDNESVVKQVVRIATGSPDVRWDLTTSRRTPAGFLEELERAVALCAGTPSPRPSPPVGEGGTDAAGVGALSNVVVTPCAETDRVWVPERMARAGRVWVTEDSVSMVYEALTSGAAVGLVSVPMKADSRVATGLRSLLEEGMVTRLSDRGTVPDLKPPGVPFDEAERCAREIARRWFSPVVGEQ